MSSRSGSSGPYDAVVVGAGPAGSNCARHMARANLRVAVIDRVAPPRYKTCGGGLVARAHREIDLELGPAIERDCHVAEMRVLDSGLGFRVRRERPLVTMTMRSELDRCLIEAAQRAGAELIAPCTLEGLDSTSDGLLLRTDRGALRARFVVAADGALSPTARAARWPLHPRRVPAIESEVRVGRDDLKRLGGSALFDFGTPVHGYAWVFPKRSHLSIGCLSTRPDGQPLRQRLNAYLQRLELNVESREDHGFLIPVAPRDRVLARDRVLLTGDAAGLADAVTCEGISYALSSGRLAAEAIAAHRGQPDRVCSTYQRRLDREILPELRLSRMLARMLYDRVGLRLALFRRSGHPLCECVAEVIAGRRSYRGLLCNPANYFRLALSVARGSYATG